MGKESRELSRVSLHSCRDVYTKFLSNGKLASVVNQIGRDLPDFGVDLALGLDLAEVNDGARQAGLLRIMQER